MRRQKTFVRGNYTGHWVENPEKANSSPAKSGSLHILFNGKEEIILYDKAEHLIEKVLEDYMEPDWHALADLVFDNYIKSKASFAHGLKTIADDDRHTPQDVYMVKKILKDIFAREGFDEGDIEKELKELVNE